MIRPADLLTTVEERYYRYLRTRFYIRDSRVRDSFRQALANESLARGPFLEATPRFRHGPTLRELLAAAFPGESWDDGFLNALNADRRLYQHQADAIRAVADGRNSVVATGTGSGKTEAFILPILLHLYRQWREGRTERDPGVRALLLYPMNALVADQRDRLGQISASLQASASQFRFTFGQYIGATPDSERDRRRAPYDLFPGELGTRAKMQEAPPDVLITNYSMLEYLLIRPTDSPLFDGGRAKHWQFLVIDEAHQYRGAKGMEMAMLIRRLKDRLRNGGRTEGFRCIATSATLGDDSEGSRAAVTRFAESLFGEEFTPRGITFGTLDPVEATGTEVTDPRRYGSYLDELSTGDLTPQALARRLQPDQHFARIVEVLGRGPVALETLAGEIFPDARDTDATQWAQDLAACGVAAIPDGADAPLLPLRYHFFLRALQGVRLTFEPEPTAHLTGSGVKTESHAFELALCESCGQHYLAGRIVGDSLEPPITDSTHDEYQPTYFLRVGDDDEGDMDSGTDDHATEGSPSSHPVCAHCGKVGQDLCGHGEMIWVRTVTANRDGAITCLVCGKVGPDVIRELIHGADGPNTVIATALYAELPEERRKVLAFADSRQRAAYFAWYLSDSYASIASHNRIYRLVKSLDAGTYGVSLDDLASSLVQPLRQEGVVLPSDSKATAQRIAWVSAVREALLNDSPTSLEGTGVLVGRVQLPPWWTPPSELAARYALTPEQLGEVMQWVLQTLVDQRAVSLPERGNIAFEWEQLEVPGGPKVATVGPPSGNKQAVAIDGPTTTRVKTLAKLLGVSRSTDPYSVSQAGDLVRELLAVTIALQRQQSASDRLLIANGPGYQVNMSWWRWYVPRPEVSDGRYEFRYCQSCNRLSVWRLGDVCPTARCAGVLGNIDSARVEDNHYRNLYLAQLPGTLRAEEHTAQLQRQKALEFQQDFRLGRIHVLSSSTTFELGVDLGDLDIVFLRNVPPENFNYAQRVGRAGRRAGFPGIAITYCNRSPHDLYHFDHPEEMIAGHSRPPVIRVENDKLVVRHWAALALSMYFRDRDNQSRFGTVEDFLGGMDEPTVFASINEFLARVRPTLTGTFERVVPVDLQSVVGGVDEWNQRAFGDEGTLKDAVVAVVDDWRQARDLETRSSEAQAYKEAEWAKRRRNELAAQDVLSFLSRSVVIPKYGFPVDLVELQLLSKSPAASDVLLQRDLSQAIAEFAPTAQVVANKRVWTSRAIKRIAEREWPRGEYWTCNIHGRLEVRNAGAEFKEGPCCNRARVRAYVWPKWGFTTDRTDPTQPHSRLERLSASRPYFIQANPGRGPQLCLPPTNPVMHVHDVRPGIIMTVSEGRRGRGFYICDGCGMGWTKALPPKSHRTPYGLECAGRPKQPVSLAHQFRTQVLQIDFAVPAVPTLAFTYGLAYAFQLGAADVLEVPLTDLSALGYGSDSLSILLYDNVPGGAGLVSQLIQSEVLTESLDRAIKRLAGDCGCPEESSCYGCLRTYGNQFLHHELKRGPIYNYLVELQEHVFAGPTQ